MTTWCKELIHWERPYCWGSLRDEEKGVTVDEMVGWHRWQGGHEFEQTLGYIEGQGSLVCCGPKSQIWLSNWTTTNFPEVKASASNEGDPGLIPGSGRSPGEGNVFLPRESHGQRSLVGYSPRGCKESDMTERLHFHFHTIYVKRDKMLNKKWV